MKEKLIFKKGIREIYFPFMLNDLTPWQTQIEVQMKKTQNKFLPMKNLRWDFRIDKSGASIIAYKVKLWK